jgi:molybdopterin converting factor small subunit
VAGSITIGACLLLISDGVFNVNLLKKSVQDGLGAVAVTEEQTNTRASLITVKVYYSMMAQYTDRDEEDFVLQSPSTLQELINTVVIRHPSIAQMVQTMLILIDGVAAKSTASLRDGDVVQFIPLSAGG